MTRSAIEQLLRQRMGLDVSTIGPTSIDQALTARMKAAGSCDIETYLNLARANAGEFEELVMALAVPETWFFRDRQSFAMLKLFVETEWKPAPQPRPLRILSLPCATGEEPYSIAMTLLDVGLGGSEFHIDGMDISPEFLAIAGRGVFRPKSFRGKDLEFRRRFFSTDPDPSKNFASPTFIISDELRQAVRFSKANVLEQLFLVGCEPYNVVFCRNLLIYMDNESRRRTWQVIDKLLASGGILFTGPTETLDSPGYSKAFPSYSFAYRRVGRRQRKDAPMK